MTDTYKVGYKCRNCGAQENYDVPKGTSVREFAERTKCNNCGLTNKLMGQDEPYQE